jgi:hypothetical protein
MHKSGFLSCKLCIRDSCLFSVTQSGSYGSCTPPTVSIAAKSDNSPTWSDWHLITSVDSVYTIPRASYWAEVVVEPPPNHMVGVLLASSDLNDKSPDFYLKWEQPASSTAGSFDIHVDSDLGTRRIWVNTCESEHNQAYIYIKNNNVYDDIDFTAQLAVLPCGAVQDPGEEFVVSERLFLIHITQTYQWICGVNLLTRRPTVPQPASWLTRRCAQRNMKNLFRCVVGRDCSNI